MNENSLVTQHNNLINAKYKLNLNEKRLLVCILSKINPTSSNKDLRVEMQLKDIFQLFSLKETNYTYFIEIAKGLRKKDFPMQSLTGKLITVGWLSYAEIQEGGTLIIDIHQSVAPFILDLKEKYTKYKLENVIKFNCVHTFRVYELCKQYQKLGQRKIDIIEFKELLGIENKYKRILDFKKNVVDVTMQEINLYSDIYIEYDLQKQGRSYKYIVFSISNKEILYETAQNQEVIKQEVIKSDIDNKKQIEQEAQIKAVQSIIQEITYDDAKTLYIASKGKVGKIAEKYYMSKGKTIINLVGYLIKAIEEDYVEIAFTRENGTNPYKNRFHNFEQRTSNYTADELEKIILENQEYKLNS